MSDDNGNGKGQGESGHVVQIADRRSASGTKPEEPEIPPGPKDRNAKMRPMVVNRNELDPFSLIAQGHGTAGTRDRATLLLRDKVDLMRRAAGQSFHQLSDLVRQLEERDVITHQWFSRPWWRRVFRRVPVLPGLQLLQVEQEPQAQPQQASVEEPKAEEPTAPEGPAGA
jgi:hypothetical protein